MEIEKEKFLKEITKKLKNKFIEVNRHIYEKNKLSFFVQLKYYDNMIFMLSQFGPGGLAITWDGKVGYYYNDNHRSFFREAELTNDDILDLIKYHDSDRDIVHLTDYDSDHEMYYPVEEIIDEEYEDYQKFLKHRYNFYNYLQDLQEKTKQEFEDEEELFDRC